MSGTPHDNNNHAKQNWFMISVITYVVIGVGCIALAPVTGGVSLAGLPFMAGAIYIHGLLYACLSKNTPGH